MSEEGVTTSEVETTPLIDEQNAGKKKSNGHKMSCKCPICKNMMKKSKGSVDMMGGKKSRKVRKSKKVRKSRKSRKSRRHRKH